MTEGTKGTPGSKSANKISAANTTIAEPLYTNPAERLSSVLNSVKKDLKGNESEDVLLGLILSVRPMDKGEFARIHKDTWLYNTIQEKDHGSSKDADNSSSVTYYECHVYIEELSSILPDIDIDKIQKFTADLRKVSSQTAEAMPESKRDKAAKKLTENSKTIDKVRMEVAKISMHPVAYFASDNHPGPQFNDVVQLAVQKNAVTKFISRIDKIYAINTLIEEEG